MLRAKRKKRLALWEKANKLCFWCNCITVFPQSNSDDVPKPPNLATIDHLRSKFDLNRYELNCSNETRLVLSCQACNELKSRMEQRIHIDLELRIIHPKYLM